MVRPTRDLEHASAYRSAVHAAGRAGISVEPEAQLTEPVARLLRALATEGGIGSAAFLRETQLTGVRPDFGVLIDDRFCGWLELKAPGTGVDPTAWKGPHNQRQWNELSRLDNLLLCDGRQLRLFSEGSPDGPAVALPFEEGNWDSQKAIALLRRFATRHPRPVRSAADLAKALAPLARDLRLRIRAGLSPDTAVPAIAQAQRIWSDLLQDAIDEDRFADALAQVIAYGLVIATLDGSGDVDGDGQVSIEEAERSLKDSHRVLAATLRPVLEVAGLREVLRAETGALERLLGVVDAEAIVQRKDPRGDPWLWFYEDFLEAYDPEARRNAGVYYTPVPVVDCIVRLVEHVLTERFGLRMGFGDEQVVVLDPAVGTGTFPLAVIDHAAERAELERGAAGPSQAARGLVDRLYGFEILPGPFAVAHLRVGERLQELGATLPRGGANVVLADTLDSPVEDPSAPQLALFGPAEVLAEERRRARRIKRELQVTAIVGNPPYDRVRREDAGGWVVHGDGANNGPALFDDILGVTNERTIFSHVASLYNLYAYFWRWSIWKAFEQHGDGPAVVGLITGSSWLKAPGFIGLRELARNLCDEIWIVDLGGDNRGTYPEENVFAIESPVAIAVLVRSGATDVSVPATVHYRRIGGTRPEKLEALTTVQAPDRQPQDWTEVVSEQWAAFAPLSGDQSWEAMPDLRDLMPWQQPGCKLNRTWPVAPDRGTLLLRWRAFLEDSDPERRAALFPDPKSGRTVATQVGDLPRLVDLPADAEPEPVVPYAWRAFDRQWTFADARLAGLERPALWQALGEQQVFLAMPSVVTAGAGPVLIADSAVPDLHVFRGSYGGKDILPLYRDAAAIQPNITAGLLPQLEQRLGLADPVTPEDIASYVYAVLSTPAYQERFTLQLEDKVVRVPLTSDPALWARAVDLGAHLLWLHTFAERLRDPDAGRGDRIPHVEGLGWTRAITVMPSDASDIVYDPQANELRVGDGVVSGVRPAVWELEVSGWPVVRRWLEQRTASGRGRRSSELDTIRPETWQDNWNDELLDLLRVLTLSDASRSGQDELLELICDGPLIAADELPVPVAAERAVPKTIRRSPGADAAATLDGL